MKHDKRENCFADTPQNLEKKPNCLFIFFFSNALGWVSFRDGLLYEFTFANSRGGHLFQVGVRFEIFQMDKLFLEAKPTGLLFEVVRYLSNSSVGNECLLHRENSLSPIVASVGIRRYEN